MTELEFQAVQQWEAIFPNVVFHVKKLQGITTIPFECSWQIKVRLESEAPVY
jgi:hypothetical protein